MGVINMKYILIIFISFNLLSFDNCYSKSELKKVYKDIETCQFESKEKCFCTYKESKDLSIQDITEVNGEIIVKENATKKAEKEAALLSEKQKEEQEKLDIKASKDAIKAAKGNVDKLTNKQLTDLIEKLLILLEK
jgi:hypothetical protein